MGGFSEYDRYDAVGLAELVRRKEVSARELLDAARERCDRLNPGINAVICRLDSEAERAASSVEASRPLAGAPFLIKDLGPALAGAPLTSGSRLFANYIPAKDGELIRRFKAAGLIPFGKTNVPEFGIVPVTEPELFGACHNPWDLDRTPGGSSGGAAAAVAAGIVPAAHASDGGGSIRIPASCCGVFGLKISRGLNPKSALISTIADDFTVDHVVSRSVRDSAAILDATSNRESPGFVAGLDSEPQSLRVAVVRSAMLGMTVAPEVAAALDDAAALMDRLGHRVENAEPKIDYPSLGTAFLTYWAISARQILDGAVEIVGHKARRSEVERTTWTLAAAGGLLPDADRVRASGVIAGSAKAFNDFFNSYDVLLSPVLATPPLRIGQNALTVIESIAARIVEAIRSPALTKALLKTVAAKSFAFAAFTVPFNVSGQPAMSVPLGWTKDGLPIGMQFAAKLGADGLLLRLARQLERAQPWAQHRPTLSSVEPVREHA